MITTSPEVDKIFLALSAARTEFKPIQKTKVNPHLRNRYADLADIMAGIGDALAKFGIMPVQSVEKPEQGISVTTRLIHGSGQWIEFGPTTLPVEKMTPQSAGSAITYARRYALSAALCLVADDDDDGEAGSKTKPNGAEAAAALKAKRNNQGATDDFL